MSNEIAVGRVADLPDGGLVGVEVSGHKLILARDGEQVHAAVNRCPHLGFSLTRGPGGLRYSDGVVQCPWHNSRFDVATGKNVEWATGIAGRKVPAGLRPVVGMGRKPKDLSVLPTRIADGQVFVTVD